MAAAAGQRSRPARPTAAEGSIMPLVGHGLGILGLEEPPDVLPVLEVVLRAQIGVKAAAKISWLLFGLVVVVVGLVW